MTFDAKEFQDFCKKFTPNINMNELMDLYKKNLEFLTSCNKVLFSAMQTIYNMNIDFFKAQTSNAKSNAATILGERNVQDCMKDISSAMSSYFKDCTDHMNKIRDEMSSSGSKLSDLTKACAEESVQKIKENFSKMQESKSKK